MSNHTSLSFVLPLPEDTDRLGQALANCAFESLGGVVVWLEGELGSGKTSLVRALLRALGHTGPVKSPTYTLAELYNVSRLCLYHFDFYRFHEPEEFVDAGMQDYFDTSAACFIEWPDKAGAYAPRPDLRLCFDIDGAGRRLLANAYTERGRACLSAMSVFHPQTPKKDST